MEFAGAVYYLTAIGNSRGTGTKCVIRIGQTI